MQIDFARQKIALFTVAALFLAAWLLPNHYHPWVVAYQEFSSFFAVLLLIVVVFLSGQVEVSPKLTVFFLLPCVPLLQEVFGLIYFFGDAWIAALYLFGFALALQLGYSLSFRSGDDFSFVQLLAGVFVVGSVLSVWIALRQWLQLSGSIWVADLPPGGRPFANFAQPNSLATLLCMGLAGLLYFYERRTLGYIAASFLALLLIFGVALTQSRTPWVAATLVAVFWSFKAYRGNTRFSIYSLLVWIGIYALFVMALPYISEFLLVESSNPLERAQAMHRWGLWMQLWDAVLREPVWGYGWSQVGVAQVAISLVHPVPLMTEHSHNILLDLLVWNGPVLGGVIILCVAVWLVRLGWQSRSSEALFALMASGFVLVHGMLEYPLEYAFFLFPLGLLLGVASAEHHLATEFLLPRWMLGVVLSFGFGLFGWVWYEYRVLEEDFRLMRFETARIGELKAEQAAPDVVLLTQLRELIRFARTPATDAMDDARLESMRMVAHRFPYAPAIFRYSLALALNGKTEAAREQLLILRALHGEDDYREGMDVLRGMVDSYPQLMSVIENMPLN